MKFPLETVTPASVFSTTTKQTMIHMKIFGNRFIIRLGVAIILRGEQ